MRIFQHKLCPILVFVLLVAPGAFHGISPADETRQVRIMVFCSHNAQPYEEALEGFRQHLPREGINAYLDICFMEGDASKAARAIEKFKGGKVSLILALGSLATEVVSTGTSDIPIVAGLILEAHEMEAKENMAGVLMAIPVETQLQWMTKVLPECKNIGVLYNPARNTEKIQSAIKAASSLGLELHAQKVERPSDLPGALEYLEKRIHALWGVPDDIVYTPQTARRILLFSLQNKIPLIGLSETWVKAGALFSIDADYKDIGAQCAETAAQLLKGRKPDSIQPIYPRKTTYSLNLKTANHMKLSIPEPIIEGAHEVFR